jgi:uncharacterized protein YkwD
MTNDGILRGLRGTMICSALLAMAGCGGLATANKKSAGTLADGKFKPSADYQPAANFGPNDTLKCPTSGVNGALDDAMKREFKGDKKPVADGRLCAMAETLLGYQVDEGEPLPESVRAFLSAYFGLPVTLAPRNFLLQDLEVDLRKYNEIADGMIGPITSFAENAKSPKFGFVAARIDSKVGKDRSQMTADNPNGKTRVRMVMYDEAVQVDPLPRMLPAGGTATFSGKVAGGPKKLKVSVVDPVGKLTTTDGADGAFSAPLACGDHAGRILVQLSGDTESGDTKFANISVLCGGTLPAEVAVTPKGPAGPIDPPASEKAIAEKINTERTAAGLKPLNISAPLGEVARSLAEAQGAGKNISGGELTKMLQEKDIAPNAISETGARGFSPDEAFGQLADNPTDRASQMNANTTDLGVGVGKGPELAGKPSAVVILLYYKQAAPADPAAAKTKLYEAIAKNRAAGSVEEARQDDTLDSVAQKYAEAAAANSGQVPPEKSTEITAPLFKNSMTVNQMGGWVPDEAGVLEQAKQGTPLAKGNLVGVGVAVGKSVQYGKNSLYMVIMVGTRHETKSAKKPVKAKKK